MHYLAHRWIRLGHLSSLAALALAFPLAGQEGRSIPVEACSSPFGSLLPECQRAVTSIKPKIVGAEAVPGSASDALKSTTLEGYGRNADASVSGSGAETPKPALAQGEQAAQTNSPAGSPAEEEPEFQKFASAALGDAIPIFGSRLFRGAPSTFAPVDRVPLPGNYVVGPGDELHVQAWGQVNFDLLLTVDRQGAIFVPQVGELRVAGVELKQLKAHIQGRVSRLFRNFELAVTLGRLRSMQIYVVGAARQPGSFTVSSLSTLVSAVFATGGPSPQGSMRRIELRRGNLTAAAFDLYDLLIRGDKTADVHLLPGDVIYYPPLGPQVAIGGSIRQASIYELLGDTTLEDLVSMAGGTTPLADLGRVLVERIGSGGQRTIAELSLPDGRNRFKMQSGDVVRLMPVSPRFHDVVSIRGNVATPGRFSYFPGMKLRDLIPEKEALLTRQYWQDRSRLGFVKHEEAGPFLSSTDALADRTDVLAAMTVQVGQKTPEINWSYAVIERRDPATQANRIIPFQPGKLLLEGDESQNLSLQPDDIVTIFSQNDFNVPVAEQTRVVLIEGEVRMAGKYTLAPGETLAQLLQRAGGISGDAYLKGLQLIRTSVQKEQQRRLDAFVEEMNHELQYLTQQQMNSSLNSNELDEVSTRLGQQRKIISNLRTVRAGGRVVLPASEGAKDLSAFSDVILEHEDRIYIPFRPGVVHVLGAVANPNAFLYSAQSRVGDYLDMAGSYSPHADPKKAFLIRADGTVQARSVTGKKFSGLSLNPGDAVLVPPKLLKGNFVRGLRDWSQVFSQFALGAAAINVLK